MSATVRGPRAAYPRGEAVAQTIIVHHPLVAIVGLTVTAALGFTGPKMNVSPG